VKEAILNPSDRAALQGLIPLAGALGAGTIFALFFGARRKAGFAVFEAFVVVAVLSSVATTAYFAIALLHRNRPISDHELTQTAAPLIVAAFFLALVSIAARIPGSPRRAAPILAIALIGAAVAVLLAGQAWTTTPENAGLLAVVILAVGALLGVFAWGADRLHLRGQRRAEQQRFERLVALGYAPTGGSLSVALPAGPDDGPPRLRCWIRDGSTYLDLGALRSVRGEADRRWHELASGAGQLPTGSPVLLRVEIDPTIPWLREEPSVRLVTTSPPAEELTRELERNADGLFAVSQATPTPNPQAP
jgi:hypothetical protein